MSVALVRFSLSPASKSGGIQWQNWVNSAKVGFHPWHEAHIKCDQSFFLTVFFVFSTSSSEFREGSESPSPHSCCPSEVGREPGRASHWHCSFAGLLGQLPLSCVGCLVGQCVLPPRSAKMDQAESCPVVRPREGKTLPLLCISSCTAFASFCAREEWLMREGSKLLDTTLYTMSPVPDDLL